MDPLAEEKATLRAVQVPAGQSSLLDCHPEQELSIVVAGTAFVEVNSTTTEVPQGSAILFDSEEAHIIHNRDQNAPLTIFSAYWMPLDGAGSPEAEAATPGLEPAGV